MTVVNPFAFDIFEAVKLWMNSMIMKNQIRMYEKGYRNVPCHQPSLTR